MKMNPTPFFSSFFLLFSGTALMGNRLIERSAKMPIQNNASPYEINDEQNDLLDRVFAELPLSVRIARRIWNVNPFYIGGTAFLLGFLPLLYAIFLSPIGNVAYYKPLSFTDAANPFSCTREMLENGKCIGNCSPHPQVGVGGGRA